MDKLKEKIKIQNIIILFIILQPVIDIFTSLNVEYAEASVTLGIVFRTIFMTFCVILGLIKAQKKYKIGMFAYYGVLAVYMFSFLFNSYMENGTNLLFIQMKGLIKTFYLPILVVALIPIFKAYKVDIDKKVLVTSLMLYVITITVTSIAGIAFPTYKGGDKAGTVGLFYSANEIGAILCLLTPFLVAGFIERKLKFLDIISLALLIYAVLQVGTKVPYFGFMIFTFVIAIVCLVTAKTTKTKTLYKKAGLFFSIFILVYLVTGLTPVGKNLTKIYGDVFLITPDIFKAESTEPKESPKLTQFKNLEEVKTVVVSGRNDFLKINQTKFLEGNVASKILGIGFIENENGNYSELKLTEMDYFDILFCNGILGALLFAVPILAFAVIITRYTILDRKKIKIEQIYSMIMAFLVALSAGHVLVSPAVSIYIAIILVKYYTEIRQTENKKEIKEEEKNEENNDFSVTLVNRGS